jgi:sugar lactone lactonase YvrE/enterochelin esterase-like enzyme
MWRIPRIAFIREESALIDRAITRSPAARKGKRVHSFSRSTTCRMLGNSLETPMRASLFLALLFAPFTLADDVPTGDVFSFMYESSKIFPGTSREVTVYIPKQYDGKTPACVHVNQDGPQFDAIKLKNGKVTGPGHLDTLIHAKKIPHMIGVFVRPGVVKALTPQALDRFNRSFEYDGLGDNYARFILDEILPAVEAKAAPDGRKIVLSKDGNDRSIGGTSSGAIAAFTAAWERPDAFRRVYSGIGTYVGLRGGHNYSTLIRKTEPKPIRVFLEDGSGDLNIYGGDWWMANQSMERSLKFMGYDVAHAWGDGGHNGKHSTEVFAEQFAWLWRDHGTPIATPAGSDDFKQYLTATNGWELVGEGYKFTEGPAVNAKGEVFFCDVPESKIYKIGSDGKPAVWVTDSGKASGAAFGPDGMLYTSGSGKITKWDADGKGTLVCDGVGGNDLTVLHSGRIYTTNPNASPAEKSKVWLVNGADKKTVDTGITFANGVCTSPDQSLLYVADSRSHWVYSYQIQADGSLKHKQKYFHLHVKDSDDESGADGLRCDVKGNLWVATKMGLQVCDQPGRVHAIIPTPNGKCANLTFGGPNFESVYVTAGDKVFKRKVNTRGVNSFDAPKPPEKPRL